MRIVEQKNSLSEEDLVHLQGSSIIIKMLKQRVVIEFANPPNIEELLLYDNLGSNLVSIYK